MGCASSTPLVESGKNLVEAAKETASEAVNKGEKALQDAGEAAKDGLGHVKDSVHDVINSAESTVGSMVGKIGNTLTLQSNSAKETITDLETSKDDMLINMTDAAGEAVSEAETVLMTEVDDMKQVVMESKENTAENIEDFANDVSNEIHNDINKMEETVSDMKGIVENGIDEGKENIADTLELEDVEQHFDMLGDSIAKVEKKSEEIVESSPLGSPEKESKMEEPPPTFWEAAADAIILRKSLRAMDFRPDETEGVNEEFNVLLGIEEPKQLVSDFVVTNKNNKNVCSSDKFN